MNADAERDKLYYNTFARDTNKVALAVALSKVEVSVEGKAKQLSSTKGNFRLYSLAPGNYSLQVSHEGYVTQTVANVTVLEGKITRQEVVLVKG